MLRKSPRSSAPTSSRSSRRPRTSNWPQPRRSTRIATSTSRPRRRASAMSCNRPSTAGASSSSRVARPKISKASLPRCARCATAAATARSSAAIPSSGRRRTRSICCRRSSRSIRGKTDPLAEDDTRATTRLYLITPPALDPERFTKELEEALAGGDVACLQLRLKDIDDDAIRRAARVLKPIAQDRDVAFIMNDRPDLAAEVGADYVAFGAFFPSTTKAAKHHADPELLRDWSETTVVPCCAIGGITQEICGPLVEAGADFLAVIGAIWSHPRGPRAAVTEFNEVFARYGRAYRT